MKTLSFVVVSFASLCLPANAVAQTAATSPRVVIVTDVPAITAALAASLKAVDSIDSDIVSQRQLPADLRAYRAVIVHIEGALQATAAKAFQDYAEDGGRLILLHNSIGANKSSEWMSFVGVKLGSGDAAKGGLRNIPNATVDLVALTHRNFVIENKVAYSKLVPYQSHSRTREMTLPGLTFRGTEVFLNHTYTRVKRPLMGIKATDPRSGVTHVQDSGIWVEELDKGQIYYFMLGQTVEDFQTKAYVQMIANAVIAP